MKLTIQKETLAQGLSLVTRAVSTRSTLPVLANVLLAAEGPRLCLSATSLTVSITCWLDASIETEGRLTVPAKTLSDVIATVASGDSVSLAASDDTLNLKASMTRTRIKGISGDEFPLLPRGSDFKEAPMQMESAALRNAIHKTAFCASSDDARPILTGVLFQIKDGLCTFAATDGFRLSVAWLPVEDGLKASLKAIVPAESLEHLERLLGEEGPVSLRLLPERGQLIVTAPNAELVSQLIDGAYPDYERVIPAECKLTAEVNAAEMLTAVKAVEVFARENSHTARFAFGPEGVKLTSQAAESGSSAAVVSAHLNGGNTEPVEVAFNARYIIDALKAFKGQCTFGLNTARSAVRLTPPPGCDFQMVIMPMISAG